MGKDDKCPRIESAEAILIPHLLLSEKTNIFFPFNSRITWEISLCLILDLNIKPRSPLNQSKKELSVCVCVCRRRLCFCRWVPTLHNPPLA